MNHTADAISGSGWQSRRGREEETDAPAPTSAGVSGWTGLALGVVALFAAAWIFLPPPNYFFLRFAVGAPELCGWIGALAIVGITLGVRNASRSRTSTIAILVGLVALAMSESVFFRLGATIHDLNAQGGVMLREPADPLRTVPVSVLDLFRGVEVADARITRGIVFASPDHHPLTVDVYRPLKLGRFPVVVQLYGGSWRSGDPGEHAGFAQWLASAGYVVFAIDYRHAPQYRWPAQLDDIDSALSWIMAHSTEYEADTNRIVLLGRSAGAHLALVSAYARPRPGIRGVISFYGPIDLTEAYQHPPRPDPLHIRPIEEGFIGGPPSKFPQAYADASPMSYATADRGRSLPPTLLIYGGRDNVVEPKYARLFAEKLNESGTSAGYLEIPWAEHAFDEVFSGVSSQLSLYYTERFLAWAER